MLFFLNASIRQKRLLFLIAIFIIYAILWVGYDGLAGPIKFDERDFWQTTVEDFSQGLFPDIETLRSYEELNTPLPFIFWGALEYLFDGGIAVGRASNFALSIVMTVIVGYPRRNNENASILAMIGLFLCPYYLWVSAHLYTDLIATFFVLLGFVFSLRGRHLFSGVLLILGIAARQYMLAFPLAIAGHEFFSAWRSGRRLSVRSLIPLIAAASIVGWIVLFGGLASSEALSNRLAPPVQQVFWALTPQSSLYFLAIVCVYYVIPEYLLFNRSSLLAVLRENYRRYSLIAAVLLVLFIAFPPTLVAGGSLIKVVELLPFYWLKFILIYGLALATSCRFSKIDLSFWIVLFNVLIMLKAFQWDRYVLPLVVILWYFRAVGQLRKQSALTTERNDRR